RGVHWPVCLSVLNPDRSGSAALRHSVAMPGYPRTSEGCGLVAVTLRHGGRRRTLNNPRRYTPPRQMTRRSPHTRTASRGVVRETTQSSPPAPLRPPAASEVHVTP